MFCFDVLAWGCIESVHVRVRFYNKLKMNCKWMIMERAG